MPFTNDEQVIIQKKPLLLYIVLYASIVLFIVSLPLICFYTTSRPRYALEAFLLGFPVMLMSSHATLAWLANPMLIICWILIVKNKKAAWLFGILSVPLSISFLNCHIITDNEAGIENAITKLGPGYWLWFAACVIAAVGSTWLRLTRSKPVAY